jgi:hypothetical protein
MNQAHRAPHARPLRSSDRPQPVALWSWRLRVAGYAAFVLIGLGIICAALGWAS